MKKFILIALTLLIASPAFALEVVYPKSKEATINAPSTFFIGNTDPYRLLKINGEIVNVHPSGNFATVIKLEEGLNTFKLEAGEETLLYEIIREKNKITSTTSKISGFIEYKEVKYGIVSSDNTPMRSTPQDFGINRLSHLQENIELVIVGENNDFYKIKLTDNEFGWILKKQVDLVERADLPAKISDVNSYETNDFDIYEIQLDKKVPFKITENPFSVTFYNTDTKNNSFELNPFFKHKLFGYSGEYKDDKFILKVRKMPKTDPQKPLNGIKIAIDAGHGGREIGAIGCSGIKEKDLNLTISWKLKEELEKRGATVFMTRMFDLDKSLNNRVKYANDRDAAILISIHADALPDGQDPNKHSGTSIYYYYNQAKPLADSVMKSVLKTTEMNNNKVRQGSLALVRNTQALSILIETGFLINPADNYKLEQETFQDNFAKGVAEGIESYIKSGE